MHNIPSYRPKILGNTQSIACGFSRSGEIITGQCGEHAIFELNLAAAGLKISGTGELARWDDAEETPWAAYWDDIQTITVLDGITSISAYAFYEIDSVETLTLPESVTTIEADAFSWVETVLYAGHLMTWLRMLGDDTEWYGTVDCDRSPFTEPCGSNMTYTLDLSDGLLTISGAGPMTQ